MKIIVAQSSAGASLDGYATALCDVLAAAGHDTQRLVLPAIDAPGRALANLASFRLMGTTTADALICLDPVAAVLRHRRKLVWLLDDLYLEPDRAQLAAEPGFDRRYLANALRSALEEAHALFAPSRFALARLGKLALGRASLLQPDLPGSAAQYPRNPGPELLVLDPTDHLQRPEHLVACLAALPEPFRARLVAPSAQRESIARLRSLAADAGVEQRLAIDRREIDSGEKAYLLAHAAALIDLGRGAFAIPDAVHEAMRMGVPVIACSDGGALTELGVQPAARKPVEPNGAALAKAMLAACKSAGKKALGAAPPPAKSSTSGWAPLLKELSE